MGSAWRAYPAPQPTYGAIIAGELYTCSKVDDPVQILAVEMRQRWSSSQRCHPQQSRGTCIGRLARSHCLLPASSLPLIALEAARSDLDFERPNLTSPDKMIGCAVSVVVVKIKEELLQGGMTLFTVAIHRDHSLSSGLASILNGQT